MNQKLTEEDARESLNAHVESKGCAIRAKYGDTMGWNELMALLNDRAFVRYPCEILFDASVLQPGEFAFPHPKGDAPNDGFTIHVHPHFASQLGVVPALVLYQLVAVNYGDFASPDDAEVFGAAALGMARDDYYRHLCELADQLPHAAP